MNARQGPGGEGDGVAGVNRVAIDTNFVNRVLDTPGALDEIKAAVERGVMVIITTHIVVNKAVAENIIINICIMC